MAGILLDAQLDPMYFERLVSYVFIRVEEVTHIVFSDILHFACGGNAFVQDALRVPEIITAQRPRGFKICSLEQRLDARVYAADCSG